MIELREMQYEEGNSDFEDNETLVSFVINADFLNRIFDMFYETKEENFLWFNTYLFYDFKKDDLIDLAIYFCFEDSHEKDASFLGHLSEGEYQQLLTKAREAYQYEKQLEDKEKGEKNMDNINNLEVGDYVLNNRHELGLIKTIENEHAIIILGDDVLENIPVTSLIKVDASSFNIIPKGNALEIQDNIARQKAANFLSDVRVASNDYYLLEDSLTKLLNGDEDARLDLKPYSIGLYDKVVSAIEAVKDSPNEELYQDVYERCLEMSDEPTDYDITEIYDELLKEKMSQITVEVCDIEWDAEDVSDLPKQINLNYEQFLEAEDKEEFEDMISDYISYITGYCHKGFEYRLIDNRTQEEIDYETL